MDIKIKLNKNFTTQFNKLMSEYGTEFAEINGFNDENMNYTDFIDNFIDKEAVANASVDGNANVNQKSMATLLSEMAKPHQKLLSFNKIYYEINKKYGFRTANEWLQAEWTKALGMHDSHSASLVSYCFAYDLAPLAEKGLFFIKEFNAQPPKHLTTFIDFVKEHCSYASNLSAGEQLRPFVLFPIIIGVNFVG